MEVPLERKKVERRPGNRWYVVYAMPESEGGGTIRLRLNQCEEDFATGARRDRFNRAEYLRHIPMDDEDWPVYGRRNDTESANNTLDNSLPRERAHTVGAARQWLEMHAWQLFQNSRAVELHRRRYGTGPTQAALVA